MDYFFLLIYYFLYIYRYLIFLFVILSWFPNLRGSAFYRLIGNLTMPYLSKFRRVLPPIGGLDFSPIIAFLLLEFAIRGFAQLILA